MPPFKLPDFYRPYPARLNPNLEHARKNSKAWAFQTGLLGEGEEGEAPLWSEARFDAMDFASFTAYTHPDAPAPELDLLTEWYVWGWYVDDYFARSFEASGDLAGATSEAHTLMASLEAFMPPDLDTARPEPTNPVERALHDLWPRTAPTMSRDWRLRYVANLRRLAEVYRREMATSEKNRQRILDPIEYISMRREVSGMAWSSDLVEHSLSAEIPAHIYHARPLRVLRDTFFDTVGLRNDIISYQIDVDEGRVNNGVMVMRHFLGCELQQAVEIVNDQVTSRMQQFENTVATELAPLFEEQGVDPVARHQVLKYVKALEDWMAGDLQWELQPGGRYIPASSEGSGEADDSSKSIPLGPTGLGASAARLHLSPGALGLQRFKSYTYVPYSPVEQPKSPPFYMPFNTRVNPHVDAARQHSRQWARQMGMLDSLPGLPGIHIWDEHKFNMADLALCAALVYPGASKPELFLASDTFVWATYTDDYILEVFGHRSDMVGAKVFRARLQALMPDEPGAPALTPLTPVERGLADIWMRTASPLPMKMRREFRSYLQGWFDSWLWELNNRIQNRIPDLVDYVEMRRWVFGAMAMMGARRMAIGAGLPPGLLHTQPIRSLESSVADYADFANDILSYRRDMEYEGELNNGVLVLQSLLGIDAPKAVALLNELMTARMRQFEHVVSTELPALADDFKLDEEGRARLSGYVEGLKDWVGGLFKWDLLTGRYKESELPNASTLSRWRNRRQGMGTSAMRIAELMGGPASR